MIKNKIVGNMMIICCISTAYGMNPMDDQSLAATTGQNGLNINVDISKLELNQLTLINTDGMTSQPNYNAKAGFVLARPGNPITLNILGSGASSGLNIVADIDGGQGNPLANLGISFTNTVTGLNLSPFSIYLVGTNVSSAQTKSAPTLLKNTGNSNVTELFRINNNIDINFVAGNAPKLNLQLGNVSTTHMLQFSGAIQSVCQQGCNIAVLSDHSAAQFNLAFKATNNLTGFSLKHFYAGVQASGLVLGNTGTSSQMDTSIHNVTLGTVGQSSSSIFNGTQNAALGNFGAVGASVKELKVKISGM